ncbi:MAG: hypothetical protein AABY34_03430 [Pseudomonadota bacterium]
MMKELNYMFDEERYHRVMTPGFSRVSFGGFVGFVFVVSLIYFLVLGPEHTFLSLNALLHWIDKLSSKERLVMISFVPVYLSFMIFGGGVFGGLLGHYIQKYIFRRHHKS